METYSSAIVATSTTAATSVAEIEKFLSRRQSRQQRRCILLMETTGNFSSDGSDKNASQSTFHTVKTSGSANSVGIRCHPPKPPWSREAEIYFGIDYNSWPETLE